MKKHLFRTWIALLAALILSLSCVLGETVETTETPETAETADMTEAAEAAEETETAEAAEAEEAEAAEPAEETETLEEAEATEEATEAAEPAGPILLATVNGEEIYDNNSDITDLVNYYSSYYANYGYDTSDSAMQTLFQATGLDWAVECALYRQKAAEHGIDGLTEDEMASLEAAAREEWESAVTYYQEQLAPVSADATEEEIASARITALAYIESNFGFTEESYIREYVDGSIQTEIREKVAAAEMGDTTPTEEEIVSHFNELVEEHKSMYEGNVFMYEYYTQYMGETSYYIPEGYRGITHILLEVDEDLMNAYTDLSARFEEQQQADAEEPVEETEAEISGENAAEEMIEEALEETEETIMEAVETAEEATDEAVEDAEEAFETALDEAAEGNLDILPAEESETEPAEEIVTQEMVDAAKQAILDSVQPTIDEIMNKFNAGTPFADLIEEYGTDPGMQTEPNKSQGYMVHADSVLWDPAFTAGAMTLEKVGDVSEPVLGSYGIHILFYLRDVPAGAVDMTEDIRATLSEELQAEKESEASSAMMERWYAEADIQYTEVGQALRAAAEAAAAAQSEEEDEDEELEFDLGDDEEEYEIEWDEDEEGEYFEIELDDEDEELEIEYEEDEEVDLDSDPEEEAAEE